MHATLRVSLAPAQKRHGPGTTARPLLDAAGARVVLGAAAGANALAAPVAPSEVSLFAPRAASAAADGTFWVADTGHHRLLGWPRLPEADGTPADVVVGQPSFCQEGRNGRGEVGPATLNVPSGIAACGRALAVADGWNHRVLVWHEPPRRANQPADLVLGQVDFRSAEANRGRAEPAADSLFWPYGVAWDGARLWVADTGNRRVLMWAGLPARSGQAADLVLGQKDFACRDENAGSAPSAASMRWPHGIAFPAGGVCVADAGNNRVMLWRRCPGSNGEACDALLGQGDAAGVDHNRGEYWPSDAALNMPYAVTTVGAWLVVADTASSRLLGWRARDVEACGAPATRLAGQPDWQAKGDNRWQPPARDSVCWPFGLSASREDAVIADAGNNRVLVWRWSAEVLA